MLIVHSSNRSENLLAHLIKVLETRPLSSPFKQEHFLVQSQGMERWLCQQLAAHFPVWANYQFLFPGKFFNDLIQRMDTNLTSTVFTRERLLWVIEHNLRTTEHAILKQYLRGNQSSLKRFQLAQSLAHVFDQYQMMRPDWLNAWENNGLVTGHEVEYWQQQLWQDIVGHLGNKHRGSVWQEAIDQLNKKTVGSLALKLPERVSVLGVSTIPPIFFTFIQSLSRHCDVHLYLLQPSQFYWHRSQNKTLSINNLTTECLDPPSETLENDHPLLSSCGQLAWEFQELILQEGNIGQEFSSFDDHDEPDRTNIQQLQSDLLNNRNVKIQAICDGSITFHACHSRLREVEVLKDQLLTTFEENPEIALRDVLIMAPDIQDYSPFIAAVFSDIQHTISDRNLKLNNPLVDCFIRFLTLSQSRLGWCDVMAVLEFPGVSKRFNLNASRLNIVRFWIKKLGISWGLSSQHKQQLGLPGGEQNTWNYCLSRLMMGYLMGEEDSFIADILPYSGVEENEAEALGGLYSFIVFVSQVETELKQPRSRSEWSNLLITYTEQLFSEDKESQAQLLELNNLLLELSDDSNLAATVTLDYSVIIDWLKGLLSETKSSNDFLTGQLTFCSLLPMRSIPFKVISLLGMNEGEFPKRDQFHTIDLMGLYKRPGDRSRILDDRYQFLELILSVRRKLIVTYMGQSNKNNEALSPALVIMELLQVLESQYNLKNLVTNHPLNSFSPRYFEEGSQLCSFSSVNYQTAVAVSEPVALSHPWWQGALSRQGEDLITVQELLSFFKSPQRYFFKNSLGIDLGSYNDLPDEREPFSVHGMEAYAIDQQWIEDKLNQKTVSKQHLQAQGCWPDGALSEVFFAEKNSELEAFVTLLQSYELGKKIDDMDVTIQVGRYYVTGQLTGCYPSGCLIYRYAELKGSDFLTALLQHLLINQKKPQITRLITRNKTIIFPESLCKEIELEDLIKIYCEGLLKPSALFIEPAFAYVNQHYAKSNGNRSKKKPMDFANETLEKQRGYGVAEICLLSRYLRPGENLLDSVFEEYCLNILLPIWSQVHVQDTF